MNIALAAPPPLEVRHFDADDIEQHTQQLQDWHLSYDQLDCGRFNGRFTDVRLPGMQIFLETTTRRVRQRGALMPGACGIGTILHSRGPMNVNGTEAGAGTLLAYHSDNLDFCTPPDCTLAGVVVDAKALREAVDALPERSVRLDHDGAPFALLEPTGALAHWRQLLVDALQAATDQPALLADETTRRRLRDDLFVGLVDAMTEMPDEAALPRADSRKRMVDRACGLMLSRPDDPPSLLEVCRDVGASPRKLAYSFQAVLGLSPARYVKTTRLNAVRRDLSRRSGPEQSVYDAAARWGFWHFGHFSSDYKQLFGELPSETLRRARSAQATA